MMKKNQNIVIAINKKVKKLLISLRFIIYFSNCLILILKVKNKNQNIVKIKKNIPNCSIVIKNFTFKKNYYNWIIYLLKIIFFYVFFANF